MKIAMIGIGGIAQQYYLPILAANPTLELMVFARRADTVAAASKKWRIPNVASSLQEVIRWKPEAAFVLTTSQTHLEIVKKLLEAGIDVFAEKPLTMHAAESQSLATLAEKQDRVLMVGFNRRYAPLHLRAREYWGSRKVEQAVFMKLRTKPFHDSARDHLYDDTIHLVDTLRFFCGEGLVTHSDLRVEKQFISASVQIGLESGGIAQVITTMRAGQWREQYLLAGDGLSLEVNAFRDLRISQGDEQRSWSEMYDAGADTLTGRGFVGEIDHFLSCVSFRSRPHTDAWDSVKTQRLLEAMIDK